MRTHCLLIVLGALLISHSLLAEPRVFESDIKQSTLIELYTSEGCSSCPPAERYLNSYQQHPGLWKTHFPLAFHVDYWDYLGWKDRFSKASYSERQRLYARIKQQRTIYTPAFKVNGENWRPGFYNKAISPEDKNAGKLIVTLNEKNIEAVFQPVNTEAKNLQLNVAILGMNIQSDIKAGENEGNSALHHFVVLSHKQVLSMNNQWQLQLPMVDQAETSRFAIVAWISHPDNPTPIQAVGGPL